MNAPWRRDACPGLSVPMPTGDGLLARLTPSGATIALDAFTGLCAAARTHGNGIVEITSRGSFQIRGLDAASAPAFAMEVGALGIEADDGVPILVDPLAGLEPGGCADIAALAASLRRALAAASLVLAPKVSVVLDGGQSLHLDAVAADVRVRAVFGNPAMHVALGGDAATAHTLGTVRPERAVVCVLRLLEALKAKGPRARMRDAVRGNGIGAFRQAVGAMIADDAEPAPRAGAEPIGVHALRANRVALGVGLPFGHSDADVLIRLADAACEHGASGVRTSPGRALLLVGLRPEAAQGVARRAQELGFVVDFGDPRRRVIACAGAPICASGEIPARAMAPAVAQAARDLLRPTDVVHVSGCGKGCAHPVPAPVAIVGRAGACDLVVDGALSGSLPVDAVPEAIARLARARGARP